MSTDSIAATIELARGGVTGAFAQIVRQYQSLVSGVVFNVTGDFHDKKSGTSKPKNKSSTQLEKRVLQLRKYLKDKSILGLHGRV